MGRPYYHEVLVFRRNEQGEYLIRVPVPIRGQHREEGEPQKVFYLDTPLEDPHEAIEEAIGVARKLEKGVC